MRLDLVDGFGHGVVTDMEIQNCLSSAPGCVTTPERSVRILFDPREEKYVVKFMPCVWVEEVRKEGYEGFFPATCLGLKEAIATFRKYVTIAERACGRIWNTYESVSERAKRIELDKQEALSRNGKDS